MTAAATATAQATVATQAAAATAVAEAVMPVATAPTNEGRSARSWDPDLSVAPAAAVAAVTAATVVRQGDGRGDGGGRNGRGGDSAGYGRARAPANGREVRSVGLHGLWVAVGGGSRRVGLGVCVAPAVDAEART